MTSCALAGRIYVKLVNMAAYTRDSEVTAGQLVAHHDFVIEAHLGPAGLRMTVGACFAEIA